VNGYAVLLV